MNIINQIRTLLLNDTISNLHNRSRLSVSVFEKAMEELKSVNSLALAHKANHLEIISKSQSEIDSAEALFLKNSKVIEKINDILN